MIFKVKMIIKFILLKNSSISFSSKHKINHTNPIKTHLIHLLSSMEASKLNNKLSISPIMISKNFFNWNFPLLKHRQNQKSKLFPNYHKFL